MVELAGNRTQYTHFLRLMGRTTDAIVEDEQREEIFSIERLEEYAEFLARDLTISPRRIRGRSLLKNLRKNGKELLVDYRLLADAIRQKQAVSPAAEWFVDNFHIVEDQLRDIRQHLPPNYYYGLPKLERGELKGFPRVYALALAMLAHTDCRLDAETIRRFLKAFQRVAPLSIGELWAVAISLRIGLVQNLTPLAMRIVRSRKKREDANLLADRILELAAQGNAKPEALIEMLSEGVGDPANFDRAHLVQLVQRLRDQAPDIWPAFDWLETQLRIHNTNTSRIIHLEHHRQATAQVTVGNIISSMRFLSALDWKSIFESVSLVDPILASDPSGVYARMDFATRDVYRHAIERIALGSDVHEHDVARRAIERTRQALVSDPKDFRKGHVGYYLVDEGAPELERLVGYRMRLPERWSRFLRRHPGAAYLGSFAAVTLAIVAAVLAYLDANGAAWGQLVLTGLLASLPASEFSLTMANHIVTWFLRPKELPKIDCSREIPPEAATMVVIPTLFTGAAGVRDLVDRLEVHALANGDPRLTFALLGDFADAQVEHGPQDDELRALAQSLVDQLNLRYSGAHGPRFHLFLRRRQWNAAEGKWMGWERKRGKLEEFNALLRGATSTSYIVNTASPAVLRSIRFVITLDSDTQLPREAAQRLIGTALHPLNVPVYDAEKGRVVRGYGILQPRISVSHGESARSRFAQIFSGNIGIDPYTTAVSDVYQDLIGEGSFTGKGLYVVDAFEQALRGRVPENHLLSHDLFEGGHARSALVSDIEFFDDYPEDFVTYLKRQHRWVRGDWQIADWLGPCVPMAAGTQGPNRLSLFSRWKIFDNLRRSLVPAATILWLAAAWTALVGSPALWTLFVLALLLFPIYAPITQSFVLKRGNRPWRGHFRSAWEDSTLRFKQFLFTLSLMLELGFAQIDAIARVVYRRAVSHRNLLEWVSFAQTRHKRHSWKETVGVSPWIALGLLALILFRRPEATPAAAPFLVLWATTPLQKYWLARKPRTRQRPLSSEQIFEYRTYARRTWHFFESFVREEDHYLAPDNFQEDPKPVVARRTSPTNIGLQLLSSIAAFDFGYWGYARFLDSSEKVFATLGRLPRLKGHFYNWYDTATLEPLRPMYVSTVDSGNLAAHLLTFKQACLEMAGREAFNPQAVQGLRDTLRILGQDCAQSVSPSDTLSAAAATQFMSYLAQAVEAADASDPDYAQVQTYLADAGAILGVFSPRTAGEGRHAFADIGDWIGAALSMVRSFIEDRTHPLAPAERRARWTALAQKCDALAMGMDFGFVFDSERKIFSIGFNVSDGRFDNSYYDLLASESRLASFFAIAKGDVPMEHWFRLGRQLAPVPGGAALISWTATMFEYFMPLLVMRRYEGTLIDQSYEGVIARQREYGRQREVPWGISEAGYNARDLQLNYQYGPFGVPGLGLKRGLSDDLVVSPYSTMLAAMVEPQSALANLQKLAGLGMLSRCGFYESIDYTADRLPQDQKFFILRSYMAHHQGMSLVALDNLVNGNAMQTRFHADPLVQSTQLLLQEKVPVGPELSRPRAEEVHSDGMLHREGVTSPRIYKKVDLRTPRTQVLSNGTYSVMISSAGGGYSRCGRFAINRWREDGTRDSWGNFVYVRHRQSGKFWSGTYQPTVTEPTSYEAIFAEEKTEFRRDDDDFQTHTEIVVSPEDNVEMRRISISNNSSSEAEFELTSYMEVVLAPQADDVAHPAFSNLFVQTEFLARQNTLLATRRQRSEKDPVVWGFHAVSAETHTAGSSRAAPVVLGAVQFETDRSRFLGRGHGAASPAVMSEGRPLSNTVGSVLDPIFSLRQAVRVPANATVRVTFSTGFGNSRSEAVLLADKYHDPYAFARAGELAWTQSRVQLRHLNVALDKAHVYQRLGGSLVYPNPSLRAPGHTLALNTKAQSSLWAYGISGDLPIVLTSVKDEKDMNLVRDLLHAHEYLRLKGLAFDLVILNERSQGYLQLVQDELYRQIRINGAIGLVDKPGGIFMRRVDLIPAEDLLLLQSVARVRLSADQGTLEEQLKRRESEPELPAALSRSLLRTKGNFDRYVPALKTSELRFFNGLGGFSADGKEYVTYLEKSQWTPAPWINVVANVKDFGFIVSESGAGYTWNANSRENRITPWSNDAISDPPGEVVYLRDEESGVVWTPTPLPIRSDEVHVVRHGAGFTRFESAGQGIEHELELFVPLNDTVKIARLRLRNVSGRKRRISVTSFAEWVLGTQRGSAAPFVVTEADASGTVLAVNRYNNEFASLVAFADISEREEHSFTCDRREFIGRNRDLSRPAALEREELARSSGAGLDPCVAFQGKFELKPGDTKEVIVLLGQAPTKTEALALAAKYRDSATVENAFREMRSSWDEVLTQVQIRTPDTAMDTMVNHWLLYQTLACRVWARTAFYQSGGAYGFRDQLQDVMALVHAQPRTAREQILRAAERQFVEGDVQHWWHPPTGRGVRTRFSDDLLWLPFVTAHYVKNTQDAAILDETAGFLEAPELAPGHDDAYTHPEPSAERADLYEHCARTIDRSLKVGRHGLPLMGSGDWNDGMSRVGIHGEGESVWVAWFLYTVIESFLPHVRGRADATRVARYEAHLGALKEAIEKNAWDGDWYRRAFFDDGTPLGSTVNEECRIDSIAQSWAVLSGAGDPQRSARAMAAVDEYLVHRGDGLVKLFTPPFDRSAQDPGYIKGYLPGVRENGGQYTHAALWTLMAFAKLGDGEKATELYSLLNPINHSATRAGLYRYKVEPYVAAADVYGLSPHVGRGGWTWYTGSASWMYRSALESILGLERTGSRLILSPRIPKHWSGFEVDYRHPNGTCTLRVHNRGRAGDGKGAPSFAVDLKDLQGDQSFDFDL